MTPKAQDQPHGLPRGPVPLWTLNFYNWLAYQRTERLGLGRGQHLEHVIYIAIGSQVCFGFYLGGALGLQLFCFVEQSSSFGVLFG